MIAPLSEQRRINFFSAVDEDLRHIAVPQDLQVPDFSPVFHVRPPLPGDPEALFRPDHRGIALRQELPDLFGGIGADHAAFAGDLPGDGETAEVLLPVPGVAPAGDPGDQQRAAMGIGKNLPGVLVRAFIHFPLRLRGEPPVFKAAEGRRKGVAFLPAGRQWGAPTGGGNFYLFKGDNITPEMTQAAFTFIQWMTNNPDRVAQWSIDTGYVATRPEAYETQRMIDYAAGFPSALTARDQLEFASAEFSVYDQKTVQDILDTAISPFALGTSQPATEVMVETFKGTPYDTGLDLQKLAEIAEYFRPQREEALKSGLLNTKVLGVDINTLRYQVPGGMLSNLVSQLKEAHAEDKYYDVLAEIPRVRKDFGEPPLVTPSSQIVGTQAVLNVLLGERYKMFTKESKKLLLGEFGQTVKPFNKEVQKKAIGKEEPITCRPADLLKPALAEYEEKIAPYKMQDEDVLSYALFPQVAEEFFKYRQAQKTGIDPAKVNGGSYPV